MQRLITLLAIVATLNASAYCDRGITASGEPARKGICAMDKVNGVIVPFGSKVYLPDGRVLVVKDRMGGGTLNNNLDIWIENKDECLRFGRRNLVCRVEMP